MKLTQLFLTCCLLVFVSFDLTAQEEDDFRINLGNVVSFDVTYGFHLPDGDLKDRFGNSSEIGAGLEYMTKENNWIVGVHFGYFFGKEVKEDVLINLRTPEGNIIGSNGNWANIQLLERGIHSNILVGKLFPLIKNNRRSGLRLTLGLGVLQHKIRVQQDSQTPIAQITGDYAKGYDRLSNGLSITEFVGYQHLSNNRLVNFYFGFEFVQAFTENRRDWDFTLDLKDDTKRTDLLMGIKFGWILPFYISSKASENLRY